jgi:THO complex subunit 2
MNPTNSKDPLFLPLLIVDWIWLIDQEIEGINSNFNDQVENAKFKSEQKAKIAALAKELLSKNFIPAELMKERFEVEMLEAVGLINSSKLFTKKSARINTSLLYKQTKFNLLREESEGYAKLITEISTNMYTFHPFGLSKEEIEKNEAILNERVHLVLTNIKSLIGYFALDPNRVLDIIFDIFIANVVQYYKFFINLLKASPWRSIDCSNEINNKDKMDIDDEDNNQSVKLEDLRGRSSNGQILGYKFAVYQDPESPDNASVTLYIVAALLIKNNLVNLNDLYPHLTPENDSMDEEYSLYLKEIKKSTERETEPNPLLSAGSLTDDSAPSDHKISKESNKEKEEREKEKEKKEEKKKIIKTNQKAGLLAALLSIGDLKHSKIILEISPKLGIMYHEIVHLIGRIIHVSIQPLYKKIMKIPDIEVPLEPKPYLTHHYELCNPLYEANLVIPKKKRK